MDQMLFFPLPCLQTWVRPDRLLNTAPSICFSTYWKICICGLQRQEQRHLRTRLGFRTEGSSSHTWPQNPFRTLDLLRAVSEFCRNNGSTVISGQKNRLTCISQPDLRGTSTCGPRSITVVSYKDPRSIISSSKL